MKVFCLLLLVTLCSSKNVINNKMWRPETMMRVWKVLDQFPVIDGHNDFPMAIRDLFQNDIASVNFDHDLTQEEPWSSYWANHCDLPRMRQGGMGGQFWSAYISCNAQVHSETSTVI